MKRSTKAIWRRGLALAALAAALGAGASSCALYRSDRCIVDDWQYEIAHDMFVETGSLAVVQSRLRDYQWKRCEINECVYRLEKEFEVVSE